ncbi:MAG TPA: SpoIID/LytB domain-containing protein [Candidatus Krumholzibacteria bacterium]|nr:SpoIID/LytB domain-containing protein [Candidatus Krumholzibacteria bacterium]
MRRGLIIMATLLLAGCAGSGPAPNTGAGGQTRRAGQEPIIRVLVLSSSGSATVASTGAVRVTSGAGTKLFDSDRGGTVSLQRLTQGLQVRADAAGLTATSDGEVVIDAGASPLSVGGVWYSGRVLARPSDSGGIDLINLVSLETYLQGVVPYEIGEPGPDAYAAVEAQAIAARTYAVSRMNLNRAQPYDVESGVADQVYRGNEKQSRLASSAVKDTRGLVLSYHGALCDAYYSATCGGHTSDIRTVWPDRPDAPFLHGTLDRAASGGASFCAGARNFRWCYSFSARQLGNTLRQTLPAVLGIPAASVGDLVDLRIPARTLSGRVSRLEIQTSTGNYVVVGDKIRRALMLDVKKGRILPSTMFDLEKRMNGPTLVAVDIVGGGNGHGVGMCQNGAIGMARRGYAYDMILEHYYPGSILRPGY